MKYILEYNFEDMMINLTDEEIQQIIDENGFSGITTPQLIRKYIRNKLYELFFEASLKNKEVQT